MQVCLEYQFTKNHIHGINACEMCLNQGVQKLQINKKKSMKVESQSFKQKLKMSAQDFQMPQTNQNQQEFEPINEEQQQYQYQDPQQQLYFQQNQPYQEYMEQQNQDDSQDFMQDQDLLRECMNCECCKGDVYNCQGETCQQMDYCYCLVKIEIEKDIQNKEQDDQDYYLDQFHNEIIKDQQNFQEFENYENSQQ